MLDGLQLDPVAFTLPFGNGFAVYWYGIIITLGIAIGSLWGTREITRRGKSADEFFNGLLIGILSGYLFARITYVFLDILGGNSARYDSALDWVNIRAGGVNILGGFLGAGLVVWLYVRIRGLSIWDYADITGPTILIAQAIGRWGNFINKELYGPPTDAPWGILIDNANARISPYNDLATYPLDTTRFHPTFLYESILLLAGFVLLIMLNNRYRGQWRAGVLFGLFLMWWGFGRFIIEFFRPDQTTLGESSITYSMLMAIALGLLGLFIFLRRTGRVGGSGGRTKRRPSKPKPRRS